MGDRYTGTLDAEQGKCPRIRARDFERGMNAWLKRVEAGESERVELSQDRPTVPDAQWRVHREGRRLTDLEIDACAWEGLCWLRENR